MRKRHVLIVSACALLGATTVYAGHALVRRGGGEPDALDLMARGNLWTATNVLKSLVSRDASPMNRFNLATGYQRTGRIREAESLYRDLLVDGRTTMARATPTRHGGARIFNVADEAASRLLYLDWLRSEGARRTMAEQGPGAISAGAVGVEASTTIGGPTYGDVSDEQAAALDRAARRGGRR